MVNKTLETMEEELKYFSKHRPDLALEYLLSLKDKKAKEAAKIIWFNFKLNQDRADRFSKEIINRDLSGQ